MDKTCRIAVFYDGTYFSKVSNYYLYQHERKARISINGLHDFILEEVAKEEAIEKKYCSIVDAAYFRGRLTAKQALSRDSLYSDRVFEDVLMRADVSLYQQHVAERNGELEEKRIDVWLALEAYEMASLKRYDVCVLITGDGDFVPLLRKLNTLGSRVMLLAWDFEYERDERSYVTRASQALIDKATYPVMMTEEIDARSRRGDPIVAKLFMPRAEAPPPADGPAASGETQLGVIQSLVSDKGYGFIKPDNSGDNVFFHAREVLASEFSDLAAGDSVSFTTKNTERGVQAASVRVIPVDPAA